MPIQVSFDSCCQDLLRPGATGAERALDEWRYAPQYREVVPFVENFKHSYLYELDKDAIRNVTRRSRHALGNVGPEEQLRFIEDFHAPFALQHLFHWYVETNRSLPTWTEFRDWMVIGKAAPHWYLLLKEKIGENPSEEKRRSWSRAARWRLGKFYMSAMREVDLLTRLRGLGFDLRYHILADVLFRADFWINDLIVSLYFPNPGYRQGKEKGRKPPAEKFFEGADPPFKVVHFPVVRQGYGKIWWATEDSVLRLKELIECNM